jgi:hypothetical protein
MASNGTEATRKGGQWRTWQSDEDIPQRKILIQHMYVLLLVFGRIRLRVVVSRGEKNRDFFFFLGFLSLGPNSFSNTRVKVFFERMFSPRERRIDWMLKNAFEEL